MNPQDTKVLVVGQSVWGKGDTIAEALKQMRKNGKSKVYIVYIVHPKTVMCEDGSLQYPRESPPKEIHRVGFKTK